MFWEKIKKLIKVVVPSGSSKEVKYLIILSLLLVLRTYMSIWLADVNGKIVKAIVDRNFKKFCWKVSNSIIFANLIQYRHICLRLIANNTNTEKDMDFFSSAIFIF